MEKTKKIIYMKDIKAKLPGFVNLALTLLLVLIGWVLFYYENLGDGLAHLSVMFGLGNAPLSDPTTVYYFKHNLLFLVAAALASYPWKELTILHRDSTHISWAKPFAVSLLFLLALAMIVTQSYNPFLYFQF